MKRIFTFLMLILSPCLMYCQVKGYSKFLDVNKNQFDFMVGNTGKIGDDIVIRLLNTIVNNDTLSTTLVKYNTQNDSISTQKYYKSVQGGRALIIHDSKIILNNESKPNLDKISIASIDAKTLHQDTIISLKIPDNKYYNYTISKSIVYNNKYFIGAHALNKDIFVGLLGWNQDQANAVFFVLNKNLSLDTILIYPPSKGGAIFLMEDLKVGSDSILYITFYEYYLKQFLPNPPFLASRKVIYGIDKNYNIVFKWLGGNTDLGNAPASRLAIDKNNIKYFDYKDNARHHVVAINPDSSLKWHILIDSSYQRTYNFNSLKMAKDGNLLGVGFADSGLESIGESGYAIKINAATGKIIWQRVFRVNNNHDMVGKNFWWPFRTHFEDIEELPNDDLIMVGNVREYNINTSPNKYPYDHKLWVVRTDEDGCLSKNCAYIQDIVSKKSYIPYVSPNNEWVADYSGLNPANTFIRHSFSKDSTLINGKYYRRLLSSFKATGELDNTGLFMREDNGAVYQYSNDKERLVYNMNYNVGDTIAANPNIGQPSAMVTEVGVYNLLDNIPRKYYKYTFKKCPGILVTVVEGIGDIVGFFTHLGYCSLFDGDPEFIRCFSTNGKLLYKRSGVNGCFSTSTNDLSHETKFKIFPNPAADILNIQYANNQLDMNFEINIADLSGRVLLKTNLTANDKAIDISRFQNGFYVVSILENNKLLTTQRFVKAD